MMSSRLHITVFLAFTVLIWAVASWLSSIPLSLSQLAPFSATVGVLVLSGIIADKWLWRWQLLHPWFIVPPVLHGTWKGTLTSNWINPATNQPSPPKEIYLVATQTWTSLHLRMFTDESESITLVVKDYREQDSRCLIVGVYENKPGPKQRLKNPIHHGGIMLKVQGDPPKGLEGSYWTDKPEATAGVLTFLEKNQECFSSFEEAAAATYVRLLAKK